MPSANGGRSRQPSPPAHFSVLAFTLYRGPQSHAPPTATATTPPSIARRTWSNVAPLTKIYTPTRTRTSRRVASRRTYDVVYEYTLPKFRYRFLAGSLFPFLSLRTPHFVFFVLFFCFLFLFLFRFPRGKDARLTGIKLFK